MSGHGSSIWRLRNEWVGVSEVEMLRARAVGGVKGVGEIKQGLVAETHNTWLRQVVGISHYQSELRGGQKCQNQNI